MWDSKMNPCASTESCNVASVSQTGESPCVTPVDESEAKRRDATRTSTRRDRTSSPTWRRRVSLGPAQWSVSLSSELVPFFSLNGVADVGY